MRRRDPQAVRPAAPSATRRGRPIPSARTGAPAARGCRSVRSGLLRADDGRVCKSGNARSIWICDRARAGAPRRGAQAVPARSILRASRSLVRKAASEAKPNRDSRAKRVALLCNNPRLTGKAIDARLEWIVDAGKDGGALATPSEVNEPDHEWLRDSAESDSANRVQIRERVVAHFMD